MIPSASEFVRPFTHPTILSSIPPFIHPFIHLSSQLLFDTFVIPFFISHPSHLFFYLSIRLSGYQAFTQPSFYSYFSLYNPLHNLSIHACKHAPVHRKIHPQPNLAIVILTPPSPNHLSIHHSAQSIQLFIHSFIRLYILPFIYLASQPSTHLPF